MNLQTNNKGFTIVELLIVIVVIAILAAISIVAYTGIQNRARNSSAHNLAAQVAKKAEIQYALTSSYPVASSDFSGESSLEGLKVSLGTSTAGTLTAYPLAAAFSNTPSGSAATALSQFDNGNRVIYSGTTTGYIIYYRDGTGTMTNITKGTSLPTGSISGATNLNL